MHDGSIPSLHHKEDYFSHSQCRLIAYICGLRLHGISSFHFGVSIGVFFGQFMYSSHVGEILWVLVLTLLGDSLTANCLILWLL